MAQRPVEELNILLSLAAVLDDCLLNVGQFGRCRRDRAADPTGSELTPPVEGQQPERAGRETGGGCEQGPQGADTAILDVNGLGSHRGRRVLLGSVRPMLGCGGADRLDWWTLPVSLASGTHATRGALCVLGLIPDGVAPGGLVWGAFTNVRCTLIGSRAGPVLHAPGAAWDDKHLPGIDQVRVVPDDLLVRLVQRRPVVPVAVAACDLRKVVAGADDVVVVRRPLLWVGVRDGAAGSRIVLPDGMVCVPLAKVVPSAKVMPRLVSSSWRHWLPAPRWVSASFHNVVGSDVVTAGRCPAFSRVGWVWEVAA